MTQVTPETGRYVRDGARWLGGFTFESKSENATDAAQLHSAHSLAEAYLERAIAEAHIDACRVSGEEGETAFVAGELLQSLRDALSQAEEAAASLALTEHARDLAEELLSGPPFEEDEEEEAFGPQLTGAELDEWRGKQACEKCTPSDEPSPRMYFVEPHGRLDKYRCTRCNSLSLRDRGTGEYA